MITHFFGNYLLTNNLISIEQLIEVIRNEKTARVKLGLLAIDMGYMTTLEVDEVHNRQKEVDKRFGDIAVETGYLSAQQLEVLLDSQEKGYLLLGQVLIEKGYITRSLYEQAITAYEKQYDMLNIDFSDSQKDKLRLVISDFYNFYPIENKDSYVEYITLLFKNIIRFIGDDFIPLKLSIIKEYKYNCIAYQSTKDGLVGYTAIEADEEVFIEFASRYSKEALFENDQYSHSAVGEFINNQNGIFFSKTTDKTNIEIQLEPQRLFYNGVTTGFEMAFLIPVFFTFGVVNFIISTNVPVHNNCKGM